MTQHSTDKPNRCLNVQWLKIKTNLKYIPTKTKVQNIQQERKETHPKKQYGVKERGM